MARLRKSDTPIEWKLRIPTSVAEAITRHLPWDPLTNRPRLGARSDLTVRLYRAWLLSLPTSASPTAPPPAQPDIDKWEEEA